MSENVILLNVQSETVCSDKSPSLTKVEPELYGKYERDSNEESSTRTVDEKVLVNEE